MYQYCKAVDCILKTGYQSKTSLTRLVQTEKQVPLMLSSYFCFQIQILEDLDEQMYIITLEEEAIQRKLNGMFVLILLLIQYLG